VTGIDCHIGSQIVDAGPYVDALDRLLDLVERVEADGVALAHIDVGGGLGITYRDETPPGRRRADRPSARAHRRARPRCIASSCSSPGARWSATPALLIAEVLVLKPRQRAQLLHRRRGDERPDAAGDVRRLDAHRRVRAGTARGGHLGRRRAGLRIGRLARPRAHASPLLAGDIVAVLSRGAYAMSMASNYNTRPRAAEVMVTGSDAVLIRDREVVARPDPRRAPAACGRAAGLAPTLPDRRASPVQIRPSSTAWQATRTPSIASSRGRSTRQRSLACGQRGLNVQPDGGFERVRHLALHRRSRAPAHVDVGDRIEEHARVGMARPREQRRLRGEFDDPAQVHHADLVADVAHDGEVVRDEEIGQAVARLQVLHDVEDLRLHRDVERRRRLVADQELRLGGERARDRDALALAARELVRELVGVGRAEADRREQLADALADAALRRRPRPPSPRSRARAAARRRCRSPSSAG
jgi:hypothetical protein